MTIYEKLKTMSIDKLREIGFSSDTAVLIVTNKLPLADIAKRNEFCPVNIGQALYGNEDIYCEGESRRCNACSLRFLNAEFKESEAME